MRPSRKTFVVNSLVGLVALFGSPVADGIELQPRRTQADTGPDVQPMPVCLCKQHPKLTGLGLVLTPAHRFEGRAFLKAEFPSHDEL